MKRVSKFMKNNQYSGLTQDERFWQKVEIVDDDFCWRWVGGKQADGYGCLSYNGAMMLSHRISWIIHFGEIPDGMCICHHCDNRACVNPNHLFIGSQNDNVQDMMSKDRAYDRRGENNPKSKLCEKDILIIRKIYKSGNTSGYKLAKIYGVSQPTIMSIIHRKTWTHV